MVKKYRIAFFDASALMDHLLTTTIVFSPKQKYNIIRYKNNELMRIIILSFVNNLSYGL